MSELIDKLKALLAGKKENPISHVTLPQNVHDSIPITAVFADGTIESAPNVYTRAYDLEDINFKIAPDEDQTNIYRAYGDLLNSFPANVRFQVIIQNCTADRRSTLEDIRLKLRRDGLNKYRQEMNGIFLDRLTGGRKSLKQEKYLVVSVHEPDMYRAMKTLAGIDKEVEKNVRRISHDVSCRPQTAEERLEHLFQIYNQDQQAVFYNTYGADGRPCFSYDALLRQNGINVKDIIGPSGMEFKTDKFMLGNTYGRVLYLVDVGSSLNTNFISDLSDMPGSMLLSISHKPIETTKALRMIQNKMTEINGEIGQSQRRASQEGYSVTVLPPNLEIAQQQTRNLLDDVISRDQKVFYITFTIALFAESETELEEMTRILTSIAGKYLCPFKTLRFQQEQGLNTTLPLGLCELDVKRLFTTECAAIFIPYTSLELHQKDGIYYGQNQTSGNMILYSRYTGKNYNGLIFGESGSGKSMAAKMEMVNVLLRSDKNYVYVIDPEEEYVSMAHALNGEVVNIAPGSRTFLNPLDMDMDYDGEADPVGMKLDYVISMIEIMLGPEKYLDPQAKSVCGRCVRTIYRNYMRHMDDLKAAGSDITCDRAAMPTLNNLYNELLRQEEPEARSLASIIEPYAAGSFATFASRTNVETKAHFVVYDTNHLGNGMKDLGLHVCLNEIWNKMIENHRMGSDVYTWIYIDEFYLLLQSNSAAKFLMQVWKRARKWHGVPTGIMQNTEDLLRTADARNIINNTSFIIMNNLPKLDRTNLRDLLNIPDSQLEYITNADPGHGLIFNGKTVLPYVNLMPKDTELYKLMDTSGRNGS